MPLDLDPDPRKDAAAPLRGGRYRLLEVLGEGGMAVVYRGVDTRLEVERAVKLLLPQMAARPRIRQRFDAEARTMARLTHPHIVAIQDVDAEEERVFLVMELLRGGNLWGWVERHGPMPARLAVDLTLPVLDALAFAHQAGVVHRDVKPQNVLLTQEGLPKLTDFGIARIESEDSRTRTAAVMGTWTYMPPEQRKSAKDTDARADLYAVGAMLWALVRAEDPPDLFAADLDASLLDGLPEPLAGVVRVATRYQRDERFPDALAMGAALLDCRAALPPVPPELEALGPAWGATGAPLTRALSASGPTGRPSGASQAGASLSPAGTVAAPGTGSSGTGSSGTGSSGTGSSGTGSSGTGSSGTGSSGAAAPDPVGPRPPPGLLATPPPPGEVAVSAGTMVPPGDGTLSFEPAEPVGREGAARAPSRLPLALALGLLLVVGAAGALGAWRWGGQGADPDLSPAATGLAPAPADSAADPAATRPGDPAGVPGAAPLDPALPAAVPSGAALAGASSSPSAPSGAASSAAPSPAAPGPSGAPPTVAAGGSAPADAGAASSTAASPADASATTSVSTEDEAPPTTTGEPATGASSPAESSAGAPASTSPASTSPTLTSPASTSPASTSPASASSSGPPGRVTVTGQVTGATLIHQGTGKRYSPGEVPAGDYWLEVRFFGTDQAVRATTIRVISEYALTVRCQSRSRTCY